MKPPPPQGNTQFRIVIIDDDYDIVQLILTILAPLGFECNYALDGPSGLDEFKRIAPHLMLLDLTLSGMSGHEVLTRVRETSTIPIIVMSAADETEQGLASFKAGADDYVTKPFDPRMLTARVVAQLRRAYRYDAPGAAPPTSAAQSAGMDASSEAASPSKAPPGWALCEICGYMAPYSKFEHEDAMGRRSLLCPHCKEADQIVFSVS